MREVETKGGRWMEVDASGLELPVGDHFMLVNDHGPVPCGLSHAFMQQLLEKEPSKVTRRVRAV